MTQSGRHKRSAIQPLEATASYTRGYSWHMPDGEMWFAAARGDNGYDMFQQATRLIDPSAARLMTTVVIDYIRDRGTVTQAVDGRIQAR